MFRVVINCLADSAFVAAAGPLVTQVRCGGIPSRNHFTICHYGAFARCSPATTFHGSRMPTANMNARDVHSMAHEVLRKRKPGEVNIAESVQSPHVIFLGSELIELHRLSMVSMGTFALQVHSLVHHRIRERIGKVTLTLEFSIPHTNARVVTIGSGVSVATLDELPR